MDCTIVYDKLKKETQQQPLYMNSHKIAFSLSIFVFILLSFKAIREFIMPIATILIISLFVGIFVYVSILLSYWSRIIGDTTSCSMSFVNNKLNTMYNIVNELKERIVKMYDTIRQLELPDASRFSPPSVTRPEIKPVIRPTPITSSTTGQRLQSVRFV